MVDRLTCPDCGAPARYVRHPESMPRKAWCAEHAPAATPPWILVARVLALLAILVYAGFKRWGRFPG